MNEISVINEETIKNKIFTIRGLQVMLDRDLAELYEVQTKVFKLHPCAWISTFKRCKKQKNITKYSNQ